MNVETCKNCNDRYLGCHDHCPKYQSALAKVLDVRRKKKKANNLEYLLNVRKK